MRLDSWKMQESVLLDSWEVDTQANSQRNKLMQGSLKLLSLISQQLNRPMLKFSLRPDDTYMHK